MHQDYNKVNSSITLFRDILKSTTSFPDLLKTDVDYETIKPLQDSLNAKLGRFNINQGFVECKETKLKITTFKNILKNRTQCKHYQKGKDNNNNELKKVHFAPNLNVKFFTKDPDTSIKKGKDIAKQNNNKNNYQNLNLADTTQNHQKTNNNVPKPDVVHIKYDVNHNKSNILQPYNNPPQRYPLTTNLKILPNNKNNY